MRNKADLQGELIKCEEEKLEVSKALVELQIENTKLMEQIQNEKYDVNNKLLNAESDIVAHTLKEEKAIQQIAELQDRLKEMIEEKRELEIEFVALKKNFIQGQGDLDMERKKNENIGIELINVMNENKALHDEINDIYKKSGSTNEENARFINKIDKLEKDNNELREALIFSKAEIERLKTEMIKFDVLEKQYKLDFDTKKVEVEQGMLEFSKQQTDELKKQQEQMLNGEKMSKEQQMLWQS